MAARVEFMAGDLERMVDMNRLGLREAALGNPLVYYMGLGFQAWAESRLGRHEAARATMQIARDLEALFGTRLMFEDWFAAARAEMALNAGQIDEALRLAPAAVDEAQAVGSLFSEAVAHRVWGQALAAVGEPDWVQAEAHLKTSLALFDKGGALIEAARTYKSWGSILMQRGNPDKARAYLEQAATQFETSGLRAELARTRNLLANLH